MRKILVTGGSGYLGSVLTPIFKKRFERVAVLDVKSPHLPSIEWFCLDIRRSSDVAELIRDFDAVVHLAAIVGDKNCDENPKEAVEINYLATKGLAELARNLDKKLLFASTCSIYGIKEGINSESSEPYPISLYALTKTKAEEEVLKNGGVSLRMGTLYGYSPSMRFDLVINDFIRKAANKEKILIFGGKQMRPFLYIKNAAKTFLISLEKNVKGAFNIADQNFSILEMGQKISKKLKADLEIIEEIQDKRSYTISTKKAQKDLGFKPGNYLNQSIIEICQHL